MPNENTMTPQMASLLVGWTSGDIGQVLGAALSVLIGDEVHCTVAGDDNQVVTVRLFECDHIGRADELVDFVLAITDSEGTPEFERVMIDIRCYRHVIRQ